MARDVKSPPVARYREHEAHESGSAIHAAIIRCHELERLRRRDLLTFLWILTVRARWWLALGAASAGVAFGIGVWLG